MAAIRLAAIGNLEQLSILFNEYRQFYEQSSDIQLATDFIKNRLSQKDSVIFVAMNEAQKLIGFCQLYPTFCSVIAAPICSLRFICQCRC